MPKKAIADVVPARIVYFNFPRSERGFASIRAATQATASMEYLGRSVVKNFPVRAGILVLIALSGSRLVLPALTRRTGLRGVGDCGEPTQFSLTKRHGGLPPVAGGGGGLTDCAACALLPNAEARQVQGERGEGGHR